MKKLTPCVAPQAMEDEERKVTKRKVRADPFRAWAEEDEEEEHTRSWIQDPVCKHPILNPPHPLHSHLRTSNPTPLANATS